MADGPPWAATPADMAMPPPPRPAPPPPVVARLMVLAVCGGLRWLRCVALRCASEWASGSKCVRMRDGSTDCRPAARAPTDRVPAMLSLKARADTWIACFPQTATKDGTSRWPLPLFRSHLRTFLFRPLACFELLLATKGGIDRIASNLRYLFRTTHLVCFEVFAPVFIPFRAHPSIIYFHSASQQQLSCKQSPTHDGNIHHRRY